MPPRIFKNPRLRSRGRARISVSGREKSEKRSVSRERTGREKERKRTRRAIRPTLFSRSVSRHNARGVSRFLARREHYERSKQRKSVSIIRGLSCRRRRRRPVGLIHSVSLYNGRHRRDTDIASCIGRCALTVSHCRGRTTSARLLRARARARQSELERERQRAKFARRPSSTLVREDIAENARRIRRFVRATRLYYFAKGETSRITAGKKYRVPLRRSSECNQLENF